MRKGAKTKLLLFSLTLASQIVLLADHVYADKSYRHGPWSCSARFRAGWIGIASLSRSKQIRMEEAGAEAGAECAYRFKRDISLGLGVGLYEGSIDIHYAASKYSGDFNTNNSSPKLHLSLSAPFRRILELGIFADYQESFQENFDVGSMELKVGKSRIGITDFASKHMALGLRVYRRFELGLSSKLHMGKGLGLMLDLAWQRFDVNVRIKLDTESKELVDSLDSDAFNVTDYKFTTNSFQLIPGAFWCYSPVCLSIRVPWAVEDSDHWMWNVVLEFKIQLPM